MRGLPPSVERLVHEEPPSEEAWGDFTREYSALLLHVARNVNRAPDDAMDAYAYLLDRLRADDCRRLKQYVSDTNSKFTTWLVVVARRLCVDHHRGKFGRLRDRGSAEERNRLGLRQRLERLEVQTNEIDAVEDEAARGPAELLDARELNGELEVLMASLEAADRLLLRLRFEDELPASEIATLLRFPSQFHVYRRINSLLATMKVKLKNRGYESAQF